MFRVRLGRKFSDIRKGYTLFPDQFDNKTSTVKKGNTVNLQLDELRTHCNSRLIAYLIENVGKENLKYRYRKEKTTPRTMSMKELQDYFNLNLPENDPLYHSWQLGKLIFTLRGINITDLLLLSSENIKGDRIIYRSTKTDGIK